MPQVENMTTDDLLRAEENAWLDMREAAQFNDDAGGSQTARYLDKVVAETFTRGVYSYDEDDPDCIKANY